MPCATGYGRTTPHDASYGTATAPVCFAACPCGVPWRVVAGSFPTARADLSDLASQVARMRYRAVRGRVGNPQFEIWSFAHIIGLRTQAEHDDDPPWNEKGNEAPKRPKASMTNADCCPRGKSSVNRDSVGGVAATAGSMLKDRRLVLAPDSRLRDAAYALSGCSYPAAPRDGVDMSAIIQEMRGHEPVMMAVAIPPRCPATPFPSAWSGTARMVSA